MKIDEEVDIKKDQIKKVIFLLINIQLISEIRLLF